MDGENSEIFNLGSNQGFSVKEIVETAREVTNHLLPVKIGKRRAGDSNMLIASSEKAKRTLGWRPTRTSVHKIIKDAWNWHRNNPNGYEA